MFEPERLIRDHIREMRPYEPILPFEVLSQELGRPPETIIKLDANENPYGPVPAVREALAQLAYPHIYPDPESRELRKALAEYHQVPMENILVGAGADELIDLIMRLLIEPGDPILNCPPTFGMYAFDADLNRARIISIPRTANFSIDVEGMEEAIRKEQPVLIFLAQPNNPDGGLVSKDDIERILRLPVIVVLDEAYIQFAPENASLIEEVLERKNLIVLRTFSKWAGLAGLRVGYGVFPSELMAHLWKIKQPYNVSVAASAAACAALRNIEQIDEITSQIIAERERLFPLLQEISYLQPIPSRANFILCQVGGHKNVGHNKGGHRNDGHRNDGHRNDSGYAGWLKAELAGRGILVRYFDKPRVNQCIRISVGTPEQTEGILEALRDLETNR